MFARLAWVARRGRGAVLEAAKTVPHVLLKPRMIFEGIRREDDEDQHGTSDGWRCYSGKPTVTYATEGQERPAYEAEVFLVFINHDGVAYNWRWEDEDPKKPGHPKDWQTRFCKSLL